MQRGHSRSLVSGALDPCNMISTNSLKVMAGVPTKQTHNKYPVELDFVTPGDSADVTPEQLDQAFDLFSTLSTSHGVPHTYFVETATSCHSFLHLTNHTSNEPLDLTKPWIHLGVRTGEVTHQFCHAAR